MKLERLTLGQVLQLSDSTDYFTVAKFLLPKNIFKIKPLEEQTFGLIKEMQQAGEQPDKMVDFFVRLRKDEPIPELVIDGNKATTERLSREDEDIARVMALDFLNFFHQWHWITNHLRVITKRESDFLGHEPTPKEEQAGIENLYKYGAFATIDILAGGDPLRYEAIEAIDYLVIFTKLRMEKERADYQINLNRQK